MTLGTSFRNGRFEMPLLRKELVGLLRTRRAFWCLVLTVAISSLIPLFTWPEAGTGYAAIMNVMTIHTFLQAQLTMALLIVPAFTAGAFSGERERETYDLLYSTLLPPTSIVLSKVIASIGYVVLLLIATAPMLCALYLLGGATFATILECYAVTFASVVFSGLICLSASMRADRTSRAAVGGVVGIVFWNGGLLFLVSLAMAILGMRTWAGQEMALILTSCLSPHAAIGLEVFTDSGLRGIGAPLTTMEPWSLRASFAALGSLVFFLILLRRARVPDSTVSLRRERRLARSGRPIRPPARSIVTRWLFRAGMAGAPLMKNPVFLKEIRTEFFGRSRTRAAAFFGSLAVFLAMAAAQGTGRGAFDWLDYAQGICCTSIVLIVLLTPAVLASAFPREMEHGSFDLLRGTLLGFREILNGKLLAGLYAWAGIIAAAGLVLVLPIGDPSPIHLLLCLGIQLMTLLTVATLSVYASALSKHTVTALLRSYGALLVWLLFLPLLLEVSDAPEEAFTMLHPIGACFSVNDDLWEHTPLTSLLLFFIIHGGVSLLLYILAIGHLELTRARDR